jgi:ABC-type enterobactin transport system permease subunit
MDQTNRHRGQWMQEALTIALAAMVAGMVAALMLIETPKSNESVIYLIAGQLIGAFATAVAYWLGSSKSSADKQRALEGRP